MKYEFKASRITKGNFFFPDKLEIDDEKVTFYKRKFIGHDTTVIQRGGIGSVSINAGMFFADIIVETRGGQVTVANGFSRSNAQEIQQILTQKKE